MKASLREDRLQIAKVIRRRPELPGEDFPKSSKIEHAENEKTLKREKILEPAFELFRIY